MGFAVLALLIACVGLYGTMSHSVARQVGEIGIRMALGAQRGAVVWVLRRVLLLAAVGLAISVPAALSASQLVKSFLFETQPNDPEIPAGRCRPPKRRDSRWLWTSKARKDENVPRPRTLIMVDPHDFLTRDTHGDTQ
jgi:ABC-type antimicrobial peptide transport system permease subunit